MVVGLLLDVTLDIGYWVVTRVGYGVVGVARYIAGLQESEDQVLMIEGPPQVASALDAAARLRAEGILDDVSYVRIVTDAVNLGTSEHKSDGGEITTLAVPAVPAAPPNPPVSVVVGQNPIPSAPPPYERLSIDFNKRVNIGN